MGAVGRHGQGHAQAQGRARGLDRNPRAHLSPFVVRLVARAHESGDALHARGIGD